MKYYFIFISFLLTYNHVSGQGCEITIQGPTPSCPGGLLLLSVEESDTLNYHWTPGDYSQPIIAVRPTITTKYVVHVSNENYDCYDSVIIKVRPKIDIEFEQFRKTCTGIDADCQAQVKAIASGAFPTEDYSYLWAVQFVDPADSSLALGLCGDVTYDITVVDSFGCDIDTSYKVKSFLSPSIETYTDPGDTVYLQNPWMDFSFENLSEDTLHLTNWFWDFGDSTTSSSATPTHMYSRADEFLVLLTVTDEHGCDTTFDHPIQVKPVKLKIPNIFTPNGDPYNQEFVITGDDLPVYNDDKFFRLEEFYLSNELVVVNRHGRKVYEANNYQNDWDGGNLPDGVYFYILNCTGQFRNDIFRGSVTILR